jgi:hypothetical protein
MQYLNKLRPFYFFAAFLLGILYVYLGEPAIRYLIRHPTPENAGKIIYKDSGNPLASKCFIYKLEEVSCPDNKTGVNIQPIAVKE